MREGNESSLLEHYHSLALRDKMLMAVVLMGLWGPVLAVVILYLVGVDPTLYRWIP